MTIRTRASNHDYDRGYESTFGPSCRLCPRLLTAEQVKVGLCDRCGEIHGPDGEPPQTPPESS